MFDLAAIGNPADIPSVVHFFPESHQHFSISCVTCSVSAEILALSSGRGAGKGGTHTIYMKWMEWKINLLYPLTNK